MPSLTCPTCAGTGWSTHGDRHTRTRMDAGKPLSLAERAAPMSRS